MFWLSSIDAHILFFSFHYSQYSQTPITFEEFGLPDSLLGIVQSAKAAELGLVPLGFTNFPFECGFLGLPPT